MTNALSFSFEEVFFFLEFFTSFLDVFEFLSHGGTQVVHLRREFRHASFQSFNYSLHLTFALYPSAGFQRVRVLLVFGHVMFDEEFVDLKPSIGDENH